MQNYEKAMDSIGDWLYIIFIAIAVISSLFSGSKKKNKQQNTMPPVVHKPQHQSSQQKTVEQQPKPQPAKMPSWMEILQSLEEKKPEQSKVKSKPQPQQVQVSQQRKFKTQFKTEKEAFLPFTEGKNKSFQSRISQKIENQVPVAEVEMETTTIDFDFKNISEIRKGIVYSEIFNRKY